MAIFDLGIAQVIKRKNLTLQDLLVLRLHLEYRYGAGLVYNYTQIKTKNAAEQLELDLCLRALAAARGCVDGEGPDNLLRLLRRNWVSIPFLLVLLLPSKPCPSPPPPSHNMIGKL